MRKYLVILFSVLFTLCACKLTGQAPAVNEQTQNPTTVPEAPNAAPSAPLSPSPNNALSPYFPLEVPNQADKGNDRFFTEFMNMLATLGFILALILIVAWFVKRMLNTRIQQINTTSPIKIIERRSLTPKTAIYLIEIYDKAIAIAESQNGVTSLADFFITPAKIESSKEPPSPFDKVLEEHMKRRDSNDNP
jgi:flagellar biogenesis protein FliO